MATPPKLYNSDRRRFTGKAKPQPQGDEKPCLVGDPGEVASRLILRNVQISREQGTDPRQNSPLSIVPPDFTEADYGPEYMRDHVPTLNDVTGMAYCKLLHSGLYREHAAEIIGFAPRTVRVWQQRGRKRLAEIAQWIENAETLAREGKDAEQLAEELGLKPKIDTHARFASASDRAYATGEQTLFSKIWDAALEGEVGCCMWLLERRDPRRYGKAAARVAEKDGPPDLEDEQSDPIAEFDALVSGYLDRAKETGVSEAAGTE